MQCHARHALAIYVSDFPTPEPLLSNSSRKPVFVFLTPLRQGKPSPCRHHPHSTNSSLARLGAGLLSVPPRQDEAPTPNRTAPAGQNWYHIPPPAPVARAA